MTDIQHTIDEDIDWLRDLACDMDLRGGDSDRLEQLAERLEEIAAIMPLVFTFVPPEAIDRALDMLDQGEQLELPLSYGGTSDTDR